MKNSLLIRKKIAVGLVPMLAAAGLVLVTASNASAAPGLTVGPATGDSDTTPLFGAPACPGGATNFAIQIEGAGFPAGSNAIGNSDIPTIDEPIADYSMGKTWNTLAGEVGGVPLPLTGTANLTLVCIGGSSAQTYEEIVNFTPSTGTASTYTVGVQATPTPPPTPPPSADSENQTVQFTVTDADGEFVWSIDGDDTVVMSTAENAGDYLQSTGAINPVLVTDNRTGAPAWSISGQVGSFTNGLSGGHLGWTPTLITSGAGAVLGPQVLPSVTPGVTDGLLSSRILANAPVGHTTSGTARLGADLEVRVPADTAPGTYTTTLTMTALS